MPVPRWAAGKAMARFQAISWLLFVCIFLNVYGIKVQEIGLSAVTETDQEVIRYYDWRVQNWVHSGRPGLFMSDDFNKMENATFYIKEGGVYYVSANLIIKTRKTWSYYYYRTTVTGEIHLSSDSGEFIAYNKHVTTYVTMRENEIKNLRISAYIQLEAGWQVSVKLGTGYGWKRIVKAGSTLSMMYVSKPSMFPGVLLTNDYEYLYLESPSYSANVVDWNEIDEGSAFPMSEGNFMVPHNSLYHILVSLVIRRYSDIVLKFSVMINNQTEAITKTTKIDSEGTTTVTLEGILDLAKNQIISITISNPALDYTYLRVYSSSTFFIFSKGVLSHATPAFSTHYKSTSTKLPANTFSKLNRWDITSKQSLNHYSNVQLQQGEFVAPKRGIYQINIALYLSNCTTAVARLSLKTDNRYQTISPDISFTKESSDCFLQNSLLLHLDTNDTLRLEVKSDMKYTVLSQTSYQVVFQTKYTLWPAAIFQLRQPFQFSTNSAAVKVHDWSHHIEGNWNDLFFNVSKDKIQIKIPGLYLFSYNLVVNATSGGQFHSQIIVSGVEAADGGSCQRGSAPEMFTCTTSTLLNLIEEDNVAVQVWMNDGTKTKHSVQVLISSRLTVTLLGDTRSHPVFKLNVQPPKTAYSTKAKSKDMKSLTDFTFPNTSFFQSGAMYSNLAKTFNSGKDIGFFLLSNLQFNLQNDGYLASVIGSEASNTTMYSKNHKKSHYSLPASDLTLDSQFYFNVSAEAPKTAFKWQPESGSVVSGVYIDKKETMTYLKAQLKPNAKLQCSSKWTQIPVSDWEHLKMLSKIAKNTTTEIQIAKSGFYLTSLNFAVKANTSNTVINVTIFTDQEPLLSASETSPADGEFSIFLQAVIEATSGRNIDIKVKCGTPTEITYAKGGGLFAFKVDEPQISPGMRKRFHENYFNEDEIGSFYPRYSYNNDDSFEEFRQDIQNDDWELTVARSGLYLITVVGYARTTYYSSDDNFELGFSSPATNTNESAACSIDSSPLYFKDSDNNDDESLGLTGFVSLNKSEVAGFLGRYDFYGVSYNSRFYMSIQFVGDIDTSSGFTATLQKDTPLAKGQNHQLPGKSWISDKMCGQYTTKDVPTQFEKYKVSYTGYYVVAMNLVLNHEDGCDFGFCFTVNGKGINGGVKGLNVGCFKQHLSSENQSSTSTVSNAELLYLEAKQELSVQLSTNLGLTISNKSSFSVFYLGTAGAILGFSSIINKIKATTRELQGYHSRYHYYYHYHYHYYDDDNDYAHYVVGGWTTTLPNTKMVFQNGIKSVDEMFVCPQDGVYMVMAKLHVKAQIQINETCKVKLQLAVDGEVLDFAFKRDVAVSGNTLSFTTTLRLEKWQGVTVRLSWKRSACKRVDIEGGSSFAVVYLDSGKKAFTLWPNIGPHIVEFPAERTVYVREDLAKFRMLNCTAVGKYPIKYEWRTYYDEVVSESSTLDTRMLNETTSDVQCIVTMRGLVAESTFVTIKAIDPTIIFSDTYSNRTYDLPEKNETTSDGYKDVLIFSAREKKPGYYYWYWERRISCSITKGNVNNTFTITDLPYYYGYGDDDQYFKLRASSLQLDREATSEYKLQITCKNIEYDDAIRAVTTIHVQILDANDNLPVFEKEIYNAKIPKNIHSGEDIIQVIATDDDIEENGKITYRLVLSSDSYIFMIDNKLGVISLKDYEQLSRPYYRLTVVATDQGDPPRSGYVTVVLEVQDFPTPNRTNNNPIFVQRQYTAYLLWGTPKGTLVTTVHAHDPVTFDHQSIRYYIFSGDESVFKVDSKTGAIKTKGDITKMQYYLEIAAEYEYKPGQKPGEFYNTTLVIVLVRKVDTSEPNFMESHYVATIPEDAKIKTKVLTVLALYTKKVEYSIPTPRGMFKIDKNTGVIRLAGKLDYEKQQQFTFVVSAKDPSKDPKGPQKSSCTDVTIYVSDRNDNPPVINVYPKKPIRIQVQGIKGRQEIGHISASDKDNGINGEIKYYLEQDDNGIFSIDHDNGTLYVNEDLGCCDMIYTLKVTAKDQGNPPQHDEVTIEIIPYDGHIHPHHTGHHSSNQKTYIIAGVVGGVVIIIILAGVIYWQRRRRQRNYASTTMNYISLPSDEEDDDLLNAASDHEDNNDNNRRLSLISAASDDNLLRNEAPC